MKIGIDARFWNQTGVGRYLRHLTSELKKLDKGNEYVLFIQPSDKRSIEKKLKNSPWKVVTTDIHWHSLQEQLQFPKVIYQENIDLMHFPYFSVPIRYNRPYIVTIHDLILHHFSTGEATTLPLPFYTVKQLAYKYIISSAARKAEHIIAVSQATKREIQDHLHVPSSRISVIYEGVDMPSSRSSSSNEWGKYFLHVGNVYPHKNCRVLIEAFVHSGLKDVKLLFVGKKDYFMQRLEREVSERKVAQVEFLGFVEDEKLASLYRHSLATVVPSLMEGFGLPVLEAMNEESLVLASDIPSLREVAGKYAFYFNPHKPSELSELLVKVATSDKTTFIDQKRGGEKRAHQFSWKDMAEQTLATYNACSASSHKR